MHTQDLTPKGFSGCQSSFLKKETKSWARKGIRDKNPLASSNAPTEFIPVTLQQAPDASRLQETLFYFKEWDLSVSLTLLKWWGYREKCDCFWQGLCLASSKTKSSFNEEKNPHHSTECHVRQPKSLALLQPLQCLLQTETWLLNQNTIKWLTWALDSQLSQSQKVSVGKDLTDCLVPCATCKDTFHWITQLQALLPLPSPPALPQTQQEPRKAWKRVSSPLPGELFHLQLQAVDFVPKLLLEEPVVLLGQLPLLLCLSQSGFEPHELVIKNKSHGGEEDRV